MNSELFLSFDFYYFFLFPKVIFTIVFDIEKCGWNENGALLFTRNSLKLYARSTLLLITSERATN